MKTGLHSKLKFRSILALRLGWPIGTYFFLVSQVTRGRPVLR